MGQRAVGARDRGRGRLLVSTAFRSSHPLLVKTTGWRLDGGFSVHHRHRRSVSRGVPKRRPGIPAACWTPLCGWTTSCAHVRSGSPVTAIDVVTAATPVPSDGRCSSRLRAQLRAVGRLAGQRSGFQQHDHAGRRVLLTIAAILSEWTGKAPGVDGEGKRSGQSRTHDCAPFKRRSHGRARITPSRFDAKTSQSRTSCPAKRRYSSSRSGRTRTSSRKNWCLPRTR